MGHERQALERETVRCMYPDELVHLLWKFKHHRFGSVGVLATRHGERIRDDLGMAPMGTIWFSEVRAEQGPNGLFYDRCLRHDCPDPMEKQGERETTYTVAKNCIPYTTIKTGRLNQVTRKFEGEIVRGWRPLFASLVKDGYLRPCDELSWLIGEDSWRKAPTHLRI